MGLLDSTLKLGSKGLTLGKKLFGVGAPKASWNNKYAQVMGKKTLIQKANKAGVVGRYAGKGVVGTQLADMIPGVDILPDAGPEDEEFQERAYNQLRYGADMTDAQLEKAMKEGKSFEDTGLIGEGGLDEEQVLQYLESESEDKRGTGEKLASGALSTLAMVPGFGTLLGTPAEMYYDKKTKEHRMMGMKNAVEKLKADANEGKIRKNMEGSLGKFMSEGLLNKEFGRGKVRQSAGGIKPAGAAADKAAEAAALKEYEAIKAKEGVHVALTHPSAKLAGRTVYEDVQEASGGDKNTAEAMLSGAGLTDDETSARYYGDPAKNAEANSATQARAAAAAQSAAEAAAKNSPAARDLAASGPIDVQPAKDAQGVRDNQALIATQKGYHGESPIAAEQRSYMEDRGVQTARGQTRALQTAGDAMYQKAYGQAPGSPEATADAWSRLYKNIAAGQKQYQANRAAAANVEYDKYIVKPGDPDYKLGPQAPKGPTDADMADYMAMTAQGGGTVAPAPAPAGKPTLDDISGMYGFKPGELEGGPSMTPEQKYGPQALAQAKKDGAFLSPNPNVMKPTPNGLGGPTPGIPQLPDIGGPARRAGEAVGSAIFSQDGTGVPLPGGAKLKAPIMGASPYGIGNSPSPSAMPQLPDIGAPGKAMGAAVGNVLFQQNHPGNPPAKKALSQEEIAKMLAEQQAAEAARKGGMKMPAPGGPSPRFQHPSQVAPAQPYKQNLNYKL